VTCAGRAAAAALLLCLPAAPFARAAEDSQRSEKAPLVGSVVRSRDYVIRRAPRKQEEFIDDVSYRRGERSARADWALYDHESQTWTLRGRVHGEDRSKDGTLLSVEGQEAIHNVKAGVGELRPPPDTGLVHLTRKWLRTVSRQKGPGSSELVSSTATDHASGRKLLWNEKAGTVRLEGNVRIDSPLGEAAGGIAVYRQAERSLTMTENRPYVVPREEGWLAAAQADEIRATEQPQKIRARGSVRGWLYFPPETQASAKQSSKSKGLWPFKGRKR